MFGKVMVSKQFVVECKGCTKNVPAGVTDFPFRSIVIECPLCGEKRQYRPSEISLGMLDYQLMKHAPRK